MVCLECTMAFGWGCLRLEATYACDDLNFMIHPFYIVILCEDKNIKYQYNEIWQFLMNIDNYNISMKSFSKVQKKSLLSTRIMENNRLSAPAQNFELMIQKQLEDDFKVHEYLNQNPNQGHNTQQYVALFNSLLVKKNNKTKRKQLLRSSKAKFQTNMSRVSDIKNNSTNRSQMQQNINVNQSPNLNLNFSLNFNQSQISPSFHMASSSPNQKSQKIDAYYSEQQYQKIKQQSQQKQEQIQSKTQQQLQMQRILLKEITQKKKSIHLLKGDISHMIARNQSISVLESKVNKVNLVSNNQQKKVSLALSKDNQQVELRKQMQKKFYNKLKIVQGIQSKNLKKIKQSYIQTMKRRKQIYDNLSLIQKQCASIQGYSDKLKQYKEKNNKTVTLFKLLEFVCTAIDKSKQLWSKHNHKSSHEDSVDLNGNEEYQAKQQKRQTINVLQFSKELKHIFFKCDRKHVQNNGLTTRKSYDCNNPNIQTHTHFGVNKSLSLNPNSTSACNSKKNLNILQSDSDPDVLLLQQITQQKLSQLSVKLIQQYLRLTQEIQQNKKMYKQHMNSIKQKCLKLNQLYVKLDQIAKELNIEQRNQLNIQNHHFSIEEYFKMVGFLQANFNIIYLLMNFFGRKIYRFGDMDLISLLYDNQKYHFTFNLSHSHNGEGDHNVGTLTETSTSKQFINPNLLQQIQIKMQGWFNLIKLKIVQCNSIPSKIKQQLQKSIFMKFIQNNRYKYRYKCNNRTKKITRINSSNKNANNSNNSSNSNIKNTATNNMGNQSRNKILKVNKKTSVVPSDHVDGCEGNGNDNNEIYKYEQNKNGEETTKKQKCSEGVTIITPQNQQQNQREHEQQGQDPQKNDDNNQNGLDTLPVNVNKYENQVFNSQYNYNDNENQNQNQNQNQYQFFDKTFKYQQNPSNQLYVFKDKINQTNHSNHINSSPNNQNITNQSKSVSLHNIYNTRKLKILAEQQTAKRVQILQKIDQNYYRMIKQTIQMQKQNTKKNYQFQRSFKRNKYSSQDELLEQKRFQATFSNLFKQDRDDGKLTKRKPLQTTTSKFLSKSIQPNNPSVSLHNSLNNNSIYKTKLKKMATSHNSASKRSPSSKFWQKHKKQQLSFKLKNILCKV